ncbi:MAG: SIMPL domain-containing protein [Roseiflexaceae bacterium]
MSKSTIVVLFFVTMIAAIVGALLPNLLVRPVTSVATVAGSSAVRQLTVNASGSVYVTPDQATIQFGVTSQASTAAEALKQNSADTTAVIEVIKKLGVAAKDISTSNFNVYPTYDSSGMRINGYQVNNAVSVVIRDIAASGNLLDQVVTAGANNINGLNFGISDVSTYQSDARTRAIDAARAKAESMAKAAGVNLGNIISINESVNYQPDMPYIRGMVADAAMAVPVETGQQEVSVSVTLVYEIR